MKHFNKVPGGRRAEIRLSLPQHVKPMKEVPGEGSLGIKIDIPIPYTTEILLFTYFIHLAIIKYEYPVKILLRALSREIENEYID